MAYLDHNPLNPRFGGFGVSAGSGAVSDAVADEIILSRSLKNPAFFSILVERYQDGFLRTAYRVVRSREEAEDIVQEALTKVYRHGGRYKKQPGASFKSWAYKILMNTALTHYRKLKRKDVNLEEFFDVILFDSGEEREGYQTNLERKDVVERALAEIPEDLAELIRLHYFEGFSYEDIAEKKGLQISTLKMRLYRARQLVKKYL